MKRGHVMTTVCIILSISFLALTTPSLLLYTAHNAKIIDSSTVKDWQMFTIALMELNHFLNFWLYCVCWREFREKSLRHIKRLLRIEG